MIESLIQHRSVKSVWAFKGVNVDFSRRLRGPYSYYDYGDYPNSGEWLPKVNKLEICHSGYHVFPVEESGYSYSRLYLVEVRGQWRSEDLITKAAWGSPKACFQELRFEALLNKGQLWHWWRPRPKTYDYAELRELLELPSDAVLLSNNTPRGLRRSNARNA